MVIELFSKSKYSKFFISRRSNNSRSREETDRQVELLNLNEEIVTNNNTANNDCKNIVSAPHFATDPKEIRSVQRSTLKKDNCKIKPQSSYLTKQKNIKEGGCDQ